MSTGREAVRVKVKKCEQNIPPEWRKFSVDPQITSLDVLYSLLAKAFDTKLDFSIKYKAFDPAGNEIWLSVLSDWDLDAAFLRIHNHSIQTTTEPCLTLQIDVKPFTEVKEWDGGSGCETPTSAVNSFSSNINASNVSNGARELMSPLQQSFGASQKYVQNMQNKLPGLIMNQMEKTFSIVQKAFNLSEETISALPPRPPLADSEFRCFLDALGQIQRNDELRKVIFLGGIDPSLRRVVWKHLLNVYPMGMNGHQRMDFMRRKSEHYLKLRDTWKLAVKQGSVIGELAYVTSMVKKDVLRTDRLHPFYAGSDDNQNIASLFNILTTYALNHPTVSYCQGMSDIASPLLVTMNDEAQAYICFCAIMSRVRGNFLLDGIAMTQKFAHLTEALSFYDPEFWEYLKAQQADDLLFCYRWLLLELKREFPFDDSLRMLEVQWSSLKYENTVGKELALYEKEFVPINEVSAPNSGNTISSSYSATPTSPSYLHMAKPRENAYAKVCALRRQSSSASLSSLSSSLGTSTKLDNTKHLNQSLDDNITRHAVRRQRRRASAKAHQSLDESKMLSLIEGSMENAKHNKEVHTTAEDTDDDVFAATNTNCTTPPAQCDKEQIIFHHTNPFKEDAQLNTKGGALQQNSKAALTSRIFLSSTSSSNFDDDINCTNNGSNYVATVDVAASDEKQKQLPQAFAKLHNKNILSNYSTVSNIIAKQLTNANGVSESVKRVTGGGSSSSGGGHFKDLKEKIAATSRMGFSFDDNREDDGAGGGGIGLSDSKSQQKLVKNFNEFLNFAAINKNRISDRFAAASSIQQPSKTPSPQQTNVPKPVVQLTKNVFATSLDESDSSSVPETTWSGSTAATTIQQAQNLSSNSLHLDLVALSPSNEQRIVQSNMHSPKEPADSNNIPTSKATFSDDSPTPDDSQDQDQEYYPMTTAITRELRLEAENLDRQVFGTPLMQKSNKVEPMATTTTPYAYDIEYEKLDRDSLDLVEDLKENEIRKIPDDNELQLRRRQRALAVKSNSEQVDTASNYRLELTINSNPFMDESLLANSSNGPPAALGATLRNSSSLPEVIVPISTESMRDVAPVELATTAIDESAYTTKSPQKFNLNGTCCTPPTLPAPSEFGGGNPFLIFLCLTLLLQHRNTIIKSAMDYNEIAMHFDKMVRKHDVTRVLNQARRMYIDYLKTQNTYIKQQQLLQQQTFGSATSAESKSNNS